MAQILFFSKDLIYDTTRQTGQLYQVVKRFTIGDGHCEKCVITGVVLDERQGYVYTMVGLSTFTTYTTRFVFDERDSADGVYADLEYPAFMLPGQVDDIVAKAAEVEQERQRKAVLASQRLHRSAVVVDYSERSLAIFTDEPADAVVLEQIRAKRNPGLMYQGRKVAGWIFPKYRQEQLAAVITI